MLMTARLLGAAGIMLLGAVPVQAQTTPGGFYIRQVISGLKAAVPSAPAPDEPSAPEPAAPAWTPVESFTTASRWEGGSVQSHVAFECKRADGAEAPAGECEGSRPSPTSKSYTARHT